MMFFIFFMYNQRFCLSAAICPRPCHGYGDGYGDEDGDGDGDGIACVW